MFTLRFDMRATAGDEAAASIRRGTPLPLLPLCGGVPSDIAWPYLERAVMASEQA